MQTFIGLVVYMLMGGFIAGQAVNTIEAKGEEEDNYAVAATVIIWPAFVTMSYVTDKGEE